MTLSNAVRTHSWWFGCRCGIYLFKKEKHRYSSTDDILDYWYVCTISQPLLLCVCVCVCVCECEREREQCATWNLNLDIVRVPVAVHLQPLIVSTGSSKGCDTFGNTKGLSSKSIVIDKPNVNCIISTMLRKLVYPCVFTKLYNNFLGRIRTVFFVHIVIIVLTCAENEFFDICCVEVWGLES